MADVIIKLNEDFNLLEFFKTPVKETEIIKIRLNKSDPKNSVSWVVLNKKNQKQLLKLFVANL